MHQSLRLDIGAAQFWQFTPAELDCAVYAKIYNQQFQLANTRLIIAQVYNLNRGKSPSKTPEELLPLSLIDSTPEKEVVTNQDDLKEIFKTWLPDAEK